MKIKDILQRNQPVFSFEFFPPKNDEGFSQLFKTMESLQARNPGFVSVTYGAGGSTRTKTLELVSRLKHKLGMESMAHLTCVGHSVDEIRDILDNLQDNKIDNILALRGDPPQGQTTFVKTENGFGFGNELVEFIKKDYSFCIGVAGYPEGHPECPDKTRDLENLKRKVDAGADFIVTQLFFDNRHYFDFLQAAESIGIKVPIIPGIMPIINFKQIKRFTNMCGATIPDALFAKLEKHQEDAEAVKKIGMEHSLAQCEELLANGAPGIHFYTMNRSNATVAILDGLMHRQK
jgi:methylenetetrahydrofolate reductase (NADPH)